MKQATPDSFHFFRLKAEPKCVNTVCSEPYVHIFFYGPTLMHHFMHTKSHINYCSKAFGFRRHHLQEARSTLSS